MIGELNRQNPYIIKLCETIEPARAESVSATNQFVRNVAIAFLTTFLISIFLFNWRFILCLFCIQIAISAHEFIMLKYTISLSPLDEITSIIYGQQYEKIYVNNEKLLVLIEDIAIFRGHCKSCIKYLNNALNISILICIIFLILNILVKYL